MENDSRRLQSIVLGRLESLERAGVMQLPKSKRRVAKAVTAPVAPPAPLAAAQPAMALIETARARTEPVADSKSTPSKVAQSSTWDRASAGKLFEDGAMPQVKVSEAASLPVLQVEVAGCTQCSELASLRTQTVFGAGNPKARLCFLGEAPGADEDRLGEPFIGRGGQLLTKIIEACRLKREDVYILNMIKCRPPGNRNPLPMELTNCRGFLERQLELIQPEFICCLGAVASQNLLSTTITIGKLRGKMHAYRGAKVVCTFHPAYLLRNPSAKKDAWEDMKFLMREMGVEL
jgi:DNA polymerase